MHDPSESSLVNQPKTNRGQETLNRICSAAEEIFFQKGYYQTGINDITSLANVSAGTFYIYFESKQNLYEYLLRQYSHEIRLHISQAIAGCKTRREAEREGLRAWLNFIAAHKYVFNITWESLFIDKRLFDAYYSTFARSYIRQLNNAKLSGEVRDIDPEVMSFVLMGMANFIGMHWIMFKEERDIDYLVNEAMKMLDGMFN